MSYSAAVRVRACSIRAVVSSVAWCRTRSRARVMMVAGREAIVPAATAAASSGRSAGSVWPANPVRGRRSAARAILRRASAALIRSRVRRNSAAFRHPSPAGSGAAADGRPPAASGPVSAWPDLPKTQPAGSCTAVSPHPVVQPTAAPDPERAAAVASRRVRATDPAATTCRYSTARETSSTSAAKSAASRKSRSSASATAIEHTLFNSSRLRVSSPDPPPSDVKAAANPAACAVPDVTLRRPRKRASGSTAGNTAHGNAPRAGSSPMASMA